MYKFRWIVILFIVSLGTALAVSCATSQKSSDRSKQLVIYTWEEMFPQEIIDAFEKDTGIKIVYKTFDENEEMLDELIRTDGGEYDLVIADDYIIEIINHPEWALAQKLSRHKIGNIDNVNAFFRHQFYDPNEEYTIPYGAGIQTIVFDPSKTKLDIRNYKDLWDSSLRNSVGIISNYRVINGMALKTLGKSYNTTNVSDIKAAGELLQSLAPNISVIKDIGLEEDLLAGSITAAVMYTDQVMKSKQANPNLKAVFPREGIGFGIMAAFVPSKAPNADAAHLFLNYILDPARGARCFEYLGYYCTFEASEEHIDPALKEFLIMPEFHTFEMIQNIPQEAEDEQDRIWIEFTGAVSNR